MASDWYSKQITNRNFLSPIGFKFLLDRAPKTIFFCQEANIPSISLGTVDVATPFKAYPIDGNITYGTLELSFLVDEDLENYLELHNWLKALGKPQNYEQYREIEQKPIYTGEGIVSDISITILSSTKLANYEVIYIDAFPVSLSGITFNTVDTDVNYLEASATFKYTYYNIEKIP